MKYNSQLTKKKKGFTLIEILVVVAIIGILAGLGISAFGKARASARDVKRKADLQQIASALELYRSDYGRYPYISDNPNSQAGGGEWTAACWRGNDNTWISDNGDYTGFAEYMAKQPQDPLGVCQWPYGDWGDGTGGASYAYASDGTKFALVVRLENHNDPDRTQIKHYPFPWGGDTSTFGGVGGPYTYWVTSQ